MGFETPLVSDESQESGDTKKYTALKLEAAIKEGKFLEAKIQRSSGEVEPGWSVVGINEDGGKPFAVVKKFNPGSPTLEKRISVEDLEKWNT